MEKAYLYRPSEFTPSPLTSIAIEPKGKLIACGTMDSNILLIDPKSGKTVQRITGHTAPVTGVSFRASSNSVLSCSWDMTTRMWNRKNIEESLVIKHPSEVKSLTVSLELGKGASGSRDGMVKIFSLRTLKTLRNLQAHRSDISGIVTLDKEQKIVTASYDGTCRLWDLSSYDAEKTLVKQKGRVRSLALSADESSVILGYQSGKISRVKISNIREKDELLGHTDLVCALSVDPTGKFLASASWDRTIRIWSLEDNTKVATGKLVTGIAAVVWSPDGSTIFSADMSGSVVSWTPSL